MTPPLAATLPFLPNGFDLADPALAHLRITATRLPLPTEPPALANLSSLPLEAFIWWPC